MEPAFVGTPPEIVIRDGMCLVTFAGESAPRYAVPVAVLVRFNQRAAVRIADWQAEERARSPVVRLRGG